MYSFDSRVRYSEIDQNGRLDVSALVNYFQDCSTFQSEDAGVGIEYCKEKGCAWILCSWQIVINRLPCLGEKIRIRTWANELRGFYGIRNYTMENDSDERLAFASSVWVYLDMKRKKPVKISDEMMNSFPIGEPIQYEWGGRKMNLPKHFERKESFVITRDNLDTNNHVNNGKYIFLAAKYLPATFKVKQIKVEYRNEAKENDIFCPCVAVSDDKIVVMFYNMSDVLYAAIEFMRE
jgi:medium-chain acyl-[acyl-carrier-protein] hydrolase